jgi:hypothetical protein
MGKKIKSVAIYTNNGTPFYEVGQFLTKPDPTKEEPNRRLESDTKVTKINASLMRKRVEIFFENEKDGTKESTLFQDFPLSIGYTM